MKQKQTRKYRDPAMDVIRCVALYTVISVHFFLNSGYYGEPVVTGGMFILTVMRTALMVCVPLFCMLSGYLTGHKSLDTKGYYKGLKKTLVTYVLACGANLIWRRCFLKETITLPFALLGVLSFTAAPYSWYIEMYIGLFLLIPFLNTLYNGLSNKKQKQILLLTMIALTALPAILNIYDFSTPGWWETPAASNVYAKLIPQWWVGIWPLTYYFLGMYLKEYGSKLNVGYNLLLYLCSVVLFGAFNFYRCYGSYFIWGDWQGYGALPNVIMASLLFSLLTKIVKIRSERVARFWERLSNLCLGAYLVSYIFDTALYPRLIQKVPNMTDRLFFYPLMTILVFICSMLLSFVLQVLAHLLDSGIMTITKMWNRERFAK